MIPFFRSETELQDDTTPKKPVNEWQAGKKADLIPHGFCPMLQIAGSLKSVVSEVEAPRVEEDG